MTVHRAQSYDPLPTIVLNGREAHDTENPATESYFRCLYTATTCTSDLIQIVDYPILSPLSKATWNFEPKRIVPITEKRSLFYNKDRTPSNSDNFLLATNGFSNTDPSLVALLLTLSDLTSKSNWKIENIQQHNYKERYSFTSSKGKVSVELNYNGKYDVSIGNVVVIEGEPSLESEVKALLHTEPVFQSQDVEFAFSLFRNHLAEKQWGIIPYKETNFKIFAVAEAEVGKIELEIDMPSAASISKRGVISNVKVKQADNITVAKQFKANFDNE